MKQPKEVTDKKEVNELRKLLLSKTEEAEQHKHEQEIALALERVQEKTLAMRSSSDISDATAIVFNELSKLGIEMDRCGIATYNETPVMEVWSTLLSSKDKQVIEVTNGNLDYRFNSLLIEIRRNWEEKKNFYSRTYTGDEVKEYYTHLLEAPDYHFPEVAQYPEKHVANIFYFGQGFIFIWTQYGLTEDVKDILKRFTKVFSLTYRRYLDIKNAEAQAREAQVEASLERVRAKAMAMHSSKDVESATAVVFNELNRLGIEMERCGISIMNETPIFEVWSTLLSPKNKEVVKVISGHLDSRTHPMNHQFHQNWQEKKDYSYYKLVGDEVRKYYDILEKQPGYHFPKIARYPDDQIAYCFFFNEGAIFVYTTVELYAEEIIIFQRFAKVFEQTYTRFLDLQKAEAQTREAQIEAALERVRAKAMAMHSSKDISGATAVVFNELTRLGVDMERCGIVILNETPVAELWSTLLSPKNKEVVNVITGHLDFRMHPMLQQFYQNWQEKKDIAYYKLVGDEVHKYYDKLAEQPDYHFPKIARYPDQQLSYCFFFNEGYVFVFTTDELNAEEKIIFRRFAKVFEQTYTRFLDLQKAEAQTREAQIEAALERVRAKAMAMHSSKDISGATAVVFNELTRLGIELERCGIILYDETAISEVWSTLLSPENREVVEVISGKLNSDIHPMLQESYKDWKNKKDFFTYELKGIEVKRYYDLLENLPEYHFPKIKNYPKVQILNTFLFDDGGLFVYTIRPLSNEVKNIFQRFTKVFSLTYRRYLDIKKAEAQAHEAQVETSLERVRAKAMAMRSSKDISGAVAVVFNELTRLGIELERCGIGIFDVDSPVMELWSTPLSQKNRQVVKVITGKVNFNIHPMTQESYRAWKERKDFYSFELKGDEVKKYYELLEKEPGYNFPKVTNFAERQILNSFNFNEGGIFVYSRERLTEGTKQIISRFAKVFSLTYKRYIDIINAENQAREAQIEASLERVRAKAMGMHSSKDISDATIVIFNELKRLGINMIRAGVVIFNETHIGEVWSTRVSPKDNQVIDIVTGNLDFKIHPMLQYWYKAWKNKQEYYTYELTGDDIRNYYELLGKQAGYRFPQTKKYPDRQIANSFYLNEVNIFAYTSEPLSDDIKQIFHRFTKVFSHTYKRYLDIVKAEAQAREAQIEASLERVRAKAMAMHSSKDVSGATAIVFDELTRLGIDMERCGIVILDETPVMEVWSTLLSPENKKVIDVINGKLNSDIHVMLQEIYKAWIDKNEFFSYTLVGDEVQRYYDKLEKEPEYQFPKTANYPDQQIANCFYFNEGYVFAYTLNNLSDNDKNVFQRFTTVFSLTYRRYQDLIIAEAQAREAIKQASLNRVRGEIASMRNAEDLKRITPVIWRELKELEVQFIRCGVFIVDEKNEKTKAYLSTPEGKALAVLNFKIDENKLTRNTVDYWKKNQVYKEHWNKEDFINWLKSIMKTGQVQSAEKYQDSATAPESLHLHFIPFKQGMLYVGNTSPLSHQELDLVKSLANSFSIAYARYEDFKNLEIAKEQIEKTLDELKAAQSQLIHSEKMASLGELTAGIAHEIQNPLNFVNNFSELSNELLGELIEEMENGNNDEVKALAEDVIQNLQKINHHGKRAGAIVKGMLQHSRTSNGQKEPTDINALCDEYLRLSYHGLRAKDNSFNADFKTEFDPNLPKITVISQDIGRVLLNLINNAFYAVSEKQKKLKGLDNYKPTVTVSTKNFDDRVEISVEDNGPGIPDDIKDKILQPFFTTKKGTQGTGLGLSITNDIIKAHGGTLHFSSSNDGAIFKILINN